MKLKYVIYMIVVGLSIASCSEDNHLTGVEEPTAEQEKVTVHINLQQELPNIATRATTPMPLEHANKIYDLWILHYTDEGLIVRSDIKQVTLSTAAIETTLNPTLTITKQNEKGTICLIANLGSQQMEWPENLGDLKKTQLLNLPFDNTGLYTDKMYMFGYYEGPIKDKMSLNILMGRMAACMNIVISANSSYTLNTQITNAVTTTHFFPMEEGDDRADLKYSTFSDNSKSVSNGSPLALYYYTGENIAPETSRRTTIKITATSGRNSKTYTIELGADSPNVENRNYSIYRNNNYTFNINLK